MFFVPLSATEGEVGISYAETVMLVKKNEEVLYFLVAISVVCETRKSFSYHWNNNSTQKIIFD
jgi:hypothetical protein